MSSDGTAPVPDHEVVVIGAGFSGIGAAIELRRAGIDDFVIVEQSHEIGGTWRDNTYPGIAVDIPSFTYQFSYEMNPNWSRTYAPGHELRAYARQCVDTYDLATTLRMDTRVVGMAFDEDRHLWRIETSAGEITARFAISAVGGLTQPKLPDIDGLDGFEGKVMHTARWDHEHDLTGERVGVIGTGASAVQVVPTIAPAVERLHVFQRTPTWVFPKADVPIGPVARRVLRHAPLAQRSVRLATAAFAESTINLGIVYHRRLPLFTRLIELAGKLYLRTQVSDPELRAKLTPEYGFFCKRPCVSNDYLRSFEHDDAELVTEPIERIAANGIETADGELREIDTLVLATGFKVFEPGNTPPFPIHGRGGVELGEFWWENRYQAYEGTSLPGFPNTFAILGPYGLTSSSWFFMVENQSHHAVRVIKEARRRGATLAEVRQEPHDRYFADVLRRQQDTIFFNNRCESSNSYYFDRHGDAPLNRPSTALEAWWRARRFDLDHYRYEPLPSENGGRDRAALQRGGRGGVARAMHRRTLLIGAVIASLALAPEAMAAELFGPPATYQNGERGLGLSPEGVAIADLDADGDSDLAVGDIAAGAVRVLLGNGDGTFGEPRVHPSGQGDSAFGFQSVEAADFDGDGRTDLAVVSTQPGTVTVIRNTGGGGFSPSASYAVGAGATTVAVGDFNGDGRADIAVANGLGAAATILLGDGAGGFTASQGPPAGPETVTVRTGDVSGDGKLDLLMGHWPLGVSVLLGAGDGTFSTNGMLLAPPGLENFEVADVNRDGHPDLVVGNVTTNQVSTYLGHGDGTFMAPVSSTVNPQSAFPPTTPNAVAVGELTGDGIPDAAVSGDFDDTIYVMAGDGSGAFATVESHEAPGNPRTVAASDLNADGHEDLVIGTAGPEIHVFLHTRGSSSARAATPRIRLSVRPRRVRALERVRFRFRVRSSAECRRGARIDVAGRHVRTDARGRASLWLRLGRSPGRRRAVARKAGCRPGVAVVLVGPRRPE